MKPWTSRLSHLLEEQRDDGNNGCSAVFVYGYPHAFLSRSPIAVSCGACSCKSSTSHVSVDDWARYKDSVERSLVVSRRAVAEVPGKPQVFRVLCIASQEHICDSFC